jgi:hypothetical protein
MRQAICNENNIVTNVVVGSISLGIPLEDNEYCEPGATYVPNGNPRFIPAPKVYTWTSYEFLNRLTASERADIRQRALTDPNVADFLMLATAAQEVVSDDPVTLMGMGYMVMIGVFTETRKNEILGP